MKHAEIETIVRKWFRAGTWRSAGRGYVEHPLAARDRQEAIAERLMLTLATELGLMKDLPSSYAGARPQRRKP